MPCLAALFALISPRLAIIFVAIFYDILVRAFDGWLLPFIGFFLLPWTTLAYAIMWDVGTSGVLRLLRKITLSGDSRSYTLPRSQAVEGPPHG